MSYSPVDPPSLRARPSLPRLRELPEDEDAPTEAPVTIRPPPPAELAELDFWTERRAPQRADRAVFSARRPPDIPLTAFEAVLLQEADGLAARFPRRDPARLRCRLLDDVGQHLDSLLEGLERPEAGTALQQAFGEAQEEVEALLQAGPPGSAAPALGRRESAVFDHLRATLPPAAFDWFGRSPEAHAASTDRILARAAVALVEEGLDTPARVDADIRRALSHDHRLRVGMGAVGQLGYAAGFYLFNRFVAPVLAPRLLQRGLLPAFGFGALAGLLVGVCDVLVASGASRVADGLCHEGGAGTPDDAVQALRRPEPRQVLENCIVAAGSSTLKNAVLRVLAPGLIIHLLAPQGISRDLRAQVDTALDTGGGLLAGALAAHLRYTLLDNPQSHAFRLLARHDLAAVLDRMRRPLEAGDMSRALRLFAEGVGRAAVAPSSYIAVLGVVTPMIGLLLSAQAALPPGVGAVTQLVAGGAAHLLGPDTHAGAGPATGALPVQAFESVLRASVSTSLMGLLAAAATAAGSVSGPRLDPPVLRCMLRAARRSAAALGGGPDGSPAPSGDGAQLLLRRRSSSALARSRV